MRKLKKEIWPFVVAVTRKDEREYDTIITWLGTHYGVFKERWNFIYGNSCLEFYFKNSNDATMFSLRWS